MTFGFPSKSRIGGVKMKRRSKILGAALLALALSLPAAPAVFAAPYWIEGTVTDYPSIRHGIRHIEVDHKDYILMKDARIWRRYEARPGAFNRKPLGFYYIKRTETVQMKVEFDRVYQIVVER
jgi:hypothetical protein